MTNNGKGRPVHLVGSVPLSSAEEVFRAVSDALNGLVRRIPDGETGARKDWILFQGDKLRAGKGVTVVGERDLPGGTSRPILNLVPGATEQDVTFGPLGYAEAAKASYATFRALRDAGKVSAGTRFQVCLPTPVAPVQGFFEKDAVRTAWPAYERRILEELAEIAQAIPHADLAVQWDICYEFIYNLEPEKSAQLFTFDELMGSVGRISDAVPAGADLGFHLCYGDLGHKHVVDPTDTTLLVEVSNRLKTTIRRPINWIHMPVPRDRSDDAYFAPLRGLKLAPETEIYVGLVHFTDGVPGAARRLAAAQKVLPEFGIATECGFGRRPVETVRPLLELHREIAEIVPA